MFSIMNEYVSNIKLTADAMTQGILNTALEDNGSDGNSLIEKSTITVRNNKFIVDIHLNEFSVENAVEAVNCFMEHTRYHYSSFYIRFNEGSRVRYRYASCKENKEGFYCDIIIS